MNTYFHSYIYIFKCILHTRLISRCIQLCLNLYIRRFKKYCLRPFNPTEEKFNKDLNSERPVPAAFLRKTRTLPCRKSDWVVVLDFGPEFFVMSCGSMRRLEGGLMQLIILDVAARIVWHSHLLLCVVCVCGKLSCIGNLWRVGLGHGKSPRRVVFVPLQRRIVQREVLQHYR